MKTSHLGEATEGDEWEVESLFSLKKQKNEYS